MAKEREQRYFVLMRARLRVGLRRADVCIRNISARGMMLQMASPPAPGSYVDITADGFSAVGRVVWRSEHKCGIRTREAIDLLALLGTAAPNLPDRRRIARTGVALARDEAARLLGRAIDFSLLGLFAAALTVGAAAAAYQALNAPMEVIRRALG